MVNTISLKELRPGLPNVIKSIDEKLDRYIITKRGQPVVVMMSIDDYEGLMETLEIMSDQDLVKSIKQGEKDIAEGRTIPFEELKKKLDEV